MRFMQVLTYRSQQSKNQASFCAIEAFVDLAFLLSLTRRTLKGAQPRLGMMSAPVMA